MDKPGQATVIDCPGQKIVSGRLKENADNVTPLRLN
jgi:hypothetical protein